LEQNLLNAILVQEISNTADIMIPDFGFAIDLVIGVGKYDWIQGSCQK
jgi:hypothetical protein